MIRARQGRRGSRGIASGCLALAAAIVVGAPDDFGPQDASEGGEGIFKMLSGDVGTKLLRPEESDRELVIDRRNLGN